MSATEIPGNDTNSRWIPLESNPDVLNSWANKAGLVAKQFQFSDVYGLDGDLLAMVPQPCKAVILIFPISPDLETARVAEDEKIEMEGQPQVDPTVLWIKQTIPNACGTIGMLHAIANSDVTVSPLSPIAKFIEQTKDKTPAERAHILETTELFASIHAEAASTGQSAVPTDLDTNMHFTCFVSAPGPVEEGKEEAGERKLRLIELDGRRNGPVDRGECVDLLEDVAKVVKDNYISGSQSMNFGMISLGPPDF